MIGSKKVLCVIPARLNSSRFPEKLLKNIANKPVLHWVHDAAKSVKIFDDVIFAIDSSKTAALIKSFGGKFVMTSEKCPCGTDRLIEVLLGNKKMSVFDIWVNWQGDEPFLTERHILQLLHNCEAEDADVWTLKKKIYEKEDIFSPQIAKVVCDTNGYALYFSRSPIPYIRDNPTYGKESQFTYYKHVGLYAYSKEALLKISKLKWCFLEDAEKLEQLRFLHNNLKIKVNETDMDAFGIDTPQDLEKAENFVENKGFVTASK